MRERPVVRKALDAYIMIVLAASSIAAGLPGSAFAVLLLAAHAFRMYRIKIRGAGQALALLFATLFIVPLLLAPITGPYAAAAAAAPLLLRMEPCLKSAGAAQTGGKFRAGRSIAPLPRTLLTALALLSLTSLVLARAELILACMLCGAYLIGILAHSVMNIPRAPISVATAQRRVLVRETVSAPLSLRTGAQIPVTLQMEPAQPWVSVSADALALEAGGGYEGSLTVTPPLAAPSDVAINATVTDPWGFVSVGQVLYPLDVHVIPKARYAEWLAEKYLEQAAAGYYPSMATPPIRVQKPSRRGVDYYGSREYQPGDRVKDVDWRHTFRLQELVVKEFAGGQVQPAIIVADLTAKDAEDADELAYSLITSALTLAREGVPVAMAAFDSGGVVESAGLASPREALIRSMVLTKRIAVAPPAGRVLQPVDPLRLRRDIHLVGAGEQGSGLGSVLDLENRAVQEAAKDAPASSALKRVAEKVGPPAAIVVVSSHDAEELSISLRAMAEKGYRIVVAGPKRHAY